MSSVSNNDRVIQDILMELIYRNFTIEKVLYNGKKIYSSLGSFLSGINSGYVGAIIKLDNTIDGDANEWRIIGVNHDDTKNTIDLMKINIGTGSMKFDSSSQVYANSAIRSYLNGDYYNAFDEEAKAHIQTMNVVSNDTTLQDKVKLLSWAELGVESYQYALNTEGTKYEYFDSSSYSTYDKKRVITNNSGNNIIYWTRSRGLGSSDFVWCVRDFGDLSGFYYCGSTSYVVPAIRLS